MATKNPLEDFGLTGTVVIVLVALGLAVAIAYGWVWLVTLLVNYVLAAFGLKPVGMLLVWVCMLLLSIVGSYFRPRTVQQ
jgi:uncharacterized membrane-anchored protein YitT (DUF2179 family)